MTDHPEKFDDEIELINYFRVIWKWKYVIVAGTLFFSLAAGILSLMQNKVYRIDLVLQPGLLRIADDGTKTFIDSPQNIKALIETGAFDEKILDSLNPANKDDLPKALSFKINIPGNSNTLKISYETSNVDQGVTILNSLGDHLTKRFDTIVEHYKKEGQETINIKQTNIENYKASVVSSQYKIKNIQKRIDELNSEINLINSNTNALIKDRDKLISDNNTNNILSSILYTNTIQQNLMLANTYKNEISRYNAAKVDEEVKLEVNQNQIKIVQEEINSLKFKFDNIQNVQVLKKATRRAYPIKPRKMLNVMLAALGGLFVMLFLAFFLEYISKYKRKENQ